jgi:hypothetical protein
MPRSKPVTLSTKIQHEIIAKSEPTTIESLRAKNPKALQSHTDRAIEQSKNKHLEQIPAASDNQLKNGDLRIKTTKLEALGQSANDWVNRAGRGTRVRVPTYCIIALGIRTNRFHPNLLFFLLCLCLQQGSRRRV